MSTEPALGRLRVGQDVWLRERQRTVCQTLGEPSLLCVAMDAEKPQKEIRFSELQDDALAGDPDQGVEDI